MLVLNSKYSRLLFGIYLLLMTSLVTFPIIVLTSKMELKATKDSKIDYLDNYIKTDLNNNELIDHEQVYYTYPKDVRILKTENDQYYKVIENTVIIDKPQGNIIRELLVDEFLLLDEFHGEYGRFHTISDNLIGYVNLGDLAISLDKPISYGVSKVDKAISNDNSYYVLAKGEAVVIKDNEQGKITILDENNLEFTVDVDSIDVRFDNRTPSRGIISRRTKSLTKLISSAYRQIGSSYVYGGIGERGYDCSGLIYSLYLNQLDIKLPRSSQEQVNLGTKVYANELVPGDLLFFNTTGRKISHVGLYIGDGKMIHASSGRGKVRIDSIISGYYKDRYVTARRIVDK